MRVTKKRAKRFYVLLVCQVQTLINMCDILSANALQQESNMYCWFQKDKAAPLSHGQQAKYLETTLTVTPFYQ